MHGEPDHAAFFYGLITFFSILPIGMFVVLALFWFVVVPGCGGDGSLATLGCITCNVKVKLMAIMTPATYFPSAAMCRNKFCAKHCGYVNGSIMLMWFLRPSLVRLGFDIFNCRHVGQPVDGKPRYLHIAMEEQCWGAEHMQYAIGVGMPMLLAYGLAVPAVIFLGLRRARAAGHSDGHANLEEPRIMLRFGLFFSGYRDERYWWEIIVILRKYAIIAVSTFIDNDTNQLQFALGLFIVVLHFTTWRPRLGEVLGTRLFASFEMYSMLILVLLLCAVFLVLEKLLLYYDIVGCTFW